MSQDYQYEHFQFSWLSHQTSGIMKTAARYRDLQNWEKMDEEDRRDDWEGQSIEGVKRVRYESEVKPLRIDSKVRDNKEINTWSCYLLWFAESGTQVAYCTNCW